MNIFDKTLIQTALGRKSKKDLNCAHTTTSDFFQFNIPYIRRMLPEEKISIDVNSFARLDQMPLPTFGDANLNLRAFFVPYRMIFKGWLDMYNDTPHVWANGANPTIPSHVPLIRNSAIVEALASAPYSRRLGIYTFVTNNIVNGEEISTILPLVANQFTGFAHNGVPLDYIRIYITRSSTEVYGLFEDGEIQLYKVSDNSYVTSFGTYLDEDGFCSIITNSATNSNATINRVVMNYDALMNLEEDERFWDYLYKTGSEPIIDYAYMVFTPFGRNIYKILRQLGYAPYWDMTTESDALMSHFEALDIFAWLKVWLDYYFPAQYYGNPVRTDLEKFITNDTPDYVITEASDVLKIFNYASIVSYTSDYLTAAFDNPSGPTADAYSSIGLPLSDPTTSLGGDVVLDPTNGTPVMFTKEATGSSIVSQYALMALRKLSDYMKRHQLAGASAVSRFYAQWGLKLDNNVANKCYYIGSHHVPMQVGDVMATADTLDADKGAVLGDYAGKGFLIGSNAHFEFTAPKEFGVFLICSSIIPKTRNYQGYDIHTLKKNKLDYFQPDFDGMSTRALEKGEALAINSDIANYDKIRTPFGFTPQYAEYKIPYDRLTGDFNVRSISKAGFTSESWHLFRKLFNTDYTDLVHSLSFVFGNDWEQYLRIFYNTTNSADHFVLNYLFKVSVWNNSKPLYDTYDFEHDEGHQVEVAVNGQRVN